MNLRNALVVLAFCSLIGMAMASTGIRSDHPLEVSLVATQSIVPGEPIFFGIQVWNSQSGATAESFRLDLGDPNHLDLAASLVNLRDMSEVVLKPSAKCDEPPVGDVLSRARVINVFPHDGQRRIGFLNLDTSTLTPGKYRLTVSAKLSSQRISGPSQDAGTWTRAATAKTIDLTVREPSDSELLAAAIRIGGAIVNSERSLTLSEGVPSNFVDIDVCLEAWSKMPAAVCISAWKEALLSPSFPCRGYAASVFSNHRCKEVRVLLQDLLEYSESHRKAKAPGHEFTAQDQLDALREASEVSEIVMAFKRVRG